MKMTLEQLNNLKDFVENHFPDRLIAKRYYDEDTDCNCVVGAMFHCKLGTLKTSTFNGNWFNTFAKTEGYLADLHKQFVETFGMTDDEVSDLQHVNDASIKSIDMSNYKNIYYTPEERAERVKQWLSIFIKLKEIQLAEGE